jgi:hypothetical protein
MKLSQKIYDSFNINNIINKEHSIFFHKKNLMQIKKRKSNICTEIDEIKITNSPKRRNKVNDPNGKNKKKN